MRQSFATGQFILLYLIIVLIYKFFDCHDICKIPEKVIFEDDENKYSHHYYYSQTIRSHQPLPVVKGRFESLVDDKEINATFPFTFYGTTVTKFEIDSYGHEFDITTMIHSNGMISFYYNNLPKVIGENRKLSSIEASAVCEDCPKHNSNKACQDATTSNTTCLWCETANMCITSNDKDLHEFKVNGCKNKNMTTDTTEHMEETKTLQYVYIVVPLVISFLILCIGCSIWLWFYRRNRVHP
ncbi:unnamed protein product [Schistosoma margrebowiei]|uniref:PSI domain-containing protein n=1 Tax=Schistosoma margrebowiei TaxID=48269 RepID=A0AA85AKG5_9TREM|nr:unnamed protein product [Schistosoma margrebowiei]